MKEYKVGDTIYAKGEIKNIDENDTSLPYFVDFGNTVWIPSDNIVDELPTAEPVKPVLPKGVADELEDAKKNNYTFVGYMNKAIVNDYDETNGFVHLINVSSYDMIKVLSDAWYNGYTVETEKKYNLILGADAGGDTSALFKNNPCTNASLLLDTDTYADDLKRDKFYQFTQEEIDKYNKDFWIKNIDLNDYKVEVPIDD